jgi:hypothetical protein
MGGEAGKEPLVVGNGYVAETGSEKKFLTLPTILTLSRVAAVPALLAGTLTLSHGDLGFWNQKRFWVCGILSMGLHFSSGVLDCGGFEGFRLDVECSLCFWFSIFLWMQFFILKKHGRRLLGRRFLCWQLWRTGLMGIWRGRYMAIFFQYFLGQGVFWDGYGVLWDGGWRKLICGVVGLWQQMGSSSEFGAFLDPVADKVSVEV